VVKAASGLIPNMQESRKKKEEKKSVANKYFLGTADHFKPQAIESKMNSTNLLSLCFNLSFCIFMTPTSL
jgi:hypothetical protein